MGKKWRDLQISWIAYRAETLSKQFQKPVFIVFGFQLHQGEFNLLFKSLNPEFTSIGLDLEFISLQLLAK